MSKPTPPANLNPRDAAKRGQPTPQKRGMSSTAKGLIIGFFLLIVISVIFSEKQPSRRTSPAVVTPSTPQISETEREAIATYFKGDEEPTAKDAVWTSSTMFKVGVLDNGSPRDGYAQYVCEVLRERGIRGVDVQVIDIAKLVRTKKWVKLGQARCP